MANIGFISLGCAKNQVNCEQMMYLLREAGHVIQADVAGADVVIVNTCGFIDSAKSEAIDNILAVGRMKEAGLVGKLLVTGCLSQRYQEEILRELPEVDGILGTGSYGEIVSAVEEVLSGGSPNRMGDINAPVDEFGRILTTPEHYAYLKIAEGCSNYCAFCIIPYLRGKYRSRPMDDVLYEARTLAADGVKELIVVAQDITLYGSDFSGGKPQLAVLLRELCKIDGFHWIRLHYLYPDEIDDELIDVIASEPKIVKYLDIPIQHINDDILKKMNRRGDGAYIEAMLNKLRERIPGVVMRTSLITGLPGEGEKEFAQLCEFLKRQRMERVGAFAYSPEEGTKAAKMERPDTETAERRADIVAELQSRIMDECNDAKIGTTLEVLVDGYDGDNDCYVGRTYADSPEIDGRVLFTTEETVKTGSFVWVKITGVQDGDLLGVRQEEA